MQHCLHAVASQQAEPNMELVHSSSTTAKQGWLEVVYYAMKWYTMLHHAMAHLYHATMRYAMPHDALSHRLQHAPNEPAALQ